VLRGASLV